MILASNQDLPDARRVGVIPDPEVPRGVCGGDERVPGAAVRAWLAPQPRYRVTSAAIDGAVFVLATDDVVPLPDGVRIEDGDEGTGVSVKHLDDARK